MQISDSLLSAIKVTFHPQQNLWGPGVLLLIDKHRRVWSTAPHKVGVPFVHERLHNNEASARALFAAWWTDFQFIQALREELHRCLGSMSLSQPGPDGLIDTGMRAIANGMIDVASALPDDVVVTFDEARSYDWYRLKAVVFASPGMADHISRILDTQKNRHAFEAALEHPMGQRHAMASPLQDVTSRFSRPAAGSNPLAARIAGLLAMRLLALVPYDPARRRLRLVWADHKPAPAPAASSPAPAPQRSTSAPAPSSNAPASVLPDDPDELSPQAQALIEAAEQGVPFCEECARLAAEQAAVQLANA